MSQTPTAPYENEITSICSAISSICLVIAVLIIGIPKLLNNGQKRRTLNLKMQHLKNLIEIESRPNSTNPQVLIEMENMGMQNQTKKSEFGSLSPSEVTGLAKTN